ncbi:eisosome assembly protein [Zygosaccharomyces mellis]|uniref:Eisosome assembly protein n=1 Tax=Zygosaccharomyces mellis TaxID=42258 RepID=A0A4C2E4P8_9SACH|nr:eisosome assembly protein [Zygosaccharomyces mellis]
MSLVSTVNDEERTDVLNSSDNANGTVVESLTATQEKPITTKSVRGFSVYHKGGGAQLSKEALYRAKVKYGIYQSPARSFTTGVAEPKVASDVAANLANDNKSTIEAYKRLFVDPNAHTAARRSLVNGGPRVEAVVIPESHYGSHQAATRAYSVASVASEENARRLQNPPSPPATRAHSLKSANKAYYGTKLPEQEEIVPKPVGKKPMDMSKVLSSAENRAQSRVTGRLDPVKVHQGISTSTQNLHKVRSTSLTGAVYKEKSDAKEASPKEASEAQGDRNLYAQWAAFAVRDMDPTALTSKEFEEKERARRELLSQITSQQVLTRARQNADRQLDAIDAQDVHRVLFGNDAYNRAAIEIAQRNAQRQAGETNVNEGKINIGGGLWLSPDDVHTIAREMVDPVLGEVHQRADDQRAADIDIKDRNDYVTSEWNAWLAMHQTKEHNNEALLINSHNKRTKEADSARTEAEKNFTELCDKMDKQVAERTDLLNQTKQAREQIERETEEKLAQNKEDNKASLRDFKGQHAKELNVAREEQKQLVQPYEERLEEANRQHETLVQERTAINEEIAKLGASIEEHKTQLSRYEREIKSQEEQHASAEEALKDLETNRQGIQSHYDDTVVINANKAKEQALLSSEEARLQNLKVEAIINERKSELNRTEQELQREKLNMLEAMRKTSEALGDENLDEERVKQLIGMTSAEYIKQQKKSQKGEKAEKPSASAAVDKQVVHENASTSGHDDLEANAKEFRERIGEKAGEAKEKHPQAVPQSTTASTTKKEKKGEPSASKRKSNGGGAHLENSSAVSQISEAVENGKHFSEEELHELADDAQQKVSDKPQSSYFKEVF